jgi:hypothetical protein
MKKLSLTLIAAILSFVVYAQQEIKVKGKVVSISKMIATDSGHYVINTEYPLRTSFILTDKRLILSNISNAVRYDLFDKDTAKINGEWVISYMTETRKEMKLIAISEINGCQDHLLLAIFPFSGSPYFVEYLLKVSSLKK